MISRNEGHNRFGKKLVTRVISNEKRVRDETKMVKYCTDIIVIDRKRDITEYKGKRDGEIIVQIDSYIRKEKKIERLP